MFSQQKLTQELHKTVRSICEEVGSQLNREYNPDVIEVIAELVYKKLVLYGSDLEAFQRHSKRSTINIDDVKLLVRRNSSLKELVDLKVQQTAQTTTTTTTTNKRKRKTTS